MNVTYKLNTSGNTSDHQQLIQQRRLARKLAVQALFEIDSVGHPPGLVVDERLAYSLPGEQGAEYLRWLVSGVVRHLEMLNNFIAKYAPEWPVDQLAIIDRNILRLGAYEILHELDTPVSVIIDEAVEIAKTFSTADSGKFVNGILDRIKDERKKQKS